MPDVSLAVQMEGREGIRRGFPLASSIVVLGHLMNAHVHNVQQALGISLIYCMSHFSRTFCEILQQWSIFFIPVFWTYFEGALRLDSLRIRRTPLTQHDGVVVINPGSWEDCRRVERGVTLLIIVII